MNSYIFQIPRHDKYLIRLWEFLSGKKYQLHKSWLAEDNLILHIGIAFDPNDLLISLQKGMEPMDMAKQITWQLKRKHEPRAYNRRKGINGPLVANRCQQCGMNNVTGYVSAKPFNKVRIPKDSQFIAVCDDAECINEAMNKMQAVCECTLDWPVLTDLTKVKIIRNSYLERVI